MQYEIWLTCRDGDANVLEDNPASNIWNVIIALRDIYYDIEKDENSRIDKGITVTNSIKWDWILPLEK